MAENDPYPDKFDHRGDEIVVDLQYRDLVLKEIQDIGVKNAEIDYTRSNEILDLGVITLGGLSGIVDRLPPAPSGLPLDALAAEIRRRFGERYRGWSPEFGKQRSVFAISATPHIGTGAPLASWHAPKKATRQEWRQTATGLTGRGIQVGLVDTRIYPTAEFGNQFATLREPVLANRETQGYLDGHATFSTGRILERAPEAQVIVRGVLNDSATATVWDIATAMVEFINTKISVLVLPLCCFTFDGEPPLALQRAVNALRGKFPVIVAAGNHNDAEPDEDGFEMKDRPAFPAACDGAIAIGAVNEADGCKPCVFSPRLPWVRGAAPGQDVVSTYLSGNVKLDDGTTDDFCGFAKWSGTSFAVATFGGEIAARMSLNGQNAFEVVDELLQQDPKQCGGIGRYTYEEQDQRSEGV
jgi:hypothetical protein